MKLFIVILVFTLSALPALAQEDSEDEVDLVKIKTDSLKSLITPNTPDSSKKHWYYSIGVIADNSDTAIKYANLSLELCRENDYIYIGDNHYNIGVSYFMQDKASEALKHFFIAEPYFEKVSLKEKIAANEIAIGKCYHDLNLNDSSLEYLGRALELFTELNDTANITYAYQSIGNVNMDLRFHETAKEYFTKALMMDSASCTYLNEAYDYQLLGYMELEFGSPKDALLYLSKSAYIFDTIPTDDAYFINLKYETYLYMAQAYITYAEQTNEPAHAQSCYNYIKKIGNYFINTNYNNNQISTLQCYARYLSFVGKDKEAIDVLLECNKYLESDQRDIYLAYHYNYLAKIYKKIGDYENALEATEMMNHYKESSINDSTMKIVAKFQAEQEVKIHKAETAAKQHQMLIIIISLIVVLILVTLLVIFIYKSLKIKRKANEDLMQKNHILDQQKSEIEAQRDEIWNQKSEIEAQKDIITKQWHAVEQVNNKLLSSINYAQRIQNAAISPQSEIDALFPNNFVYYKPRDIVSGDYYRVAKCGKYNVLITADCTGHGIPGGFLSMLGISALKEFCVTEDDAAHPGTILDRMRAFVKTTLVSEQNAIIDDGMDMTICCYDFEEMEMRYATANQSIILVRDGKAQRLNGDHMPVGRYVAEKEHFQSLLFPIQHGDIIYTFSDGIQDQTGGDPSVIYGRKFLLNNLIEFLMEVYDKPLATQRDLLDKTITEWRGERPQVDDMTLIGVRV